MPTGTLEVRGAPDEQPPDVDVDIPLGVPSSSPGSPARARARWSTARSPAGTGWSRRPGPDQGSRRSNPATYTGLPSRSARPSPRRTGQARALQRELRGRLSGVQWRRAHLHRAGLHGHRDHRLRGECEGKGFQASVLEYTFGGRNIHEVLTMPVAEAEAFFAEGPARTPAAHTIPPAPGRRRPGVPRPWASC